MRLSWPDQNSLNIFARIKAVLDWDHTTYSRPLVVRSNLGYNSLAAADESNRTIDTPAAVDSVPSIAKYNVAFPSETELLSAIRKAEFA